jgi:GNAT superfamily N-acetyltransferase
VTALETLIPLSVHALQGGHYSLFQREAALGPVFGVDRQLVSDGTYFVAESEGCIIACGGWSQRQARFGSGADHFANDTVLNPQCDPARIRAFFVHPDWVRRGIGRAILAASELAIRAAQFHSIELVATLAGEPLYSACGYGVAERYEIPLSNGLMLPVVRMTKLL